MRRPTTTWEDDDDDEGDGFISGTPAKPKKISRREVVDNAKRAFSNPMVITGIMIIFLLYWRPWASSAVAVQGTAVPRDLDGSKSARARGSSDDDVVVVDSSSTSSTKGGGGDDDDGNVLQVNTGTTAKAGAGDDVVVVDSSAASAVDAPDEDGGGSSSSSSSSSTAAVSTSSNGEVTTMVHAVDEFGTPPPSPPPKPSASSLKADRDRAARAAEAARAKSNVKKADLEKSLKRLELAMAQKTAPKSDELTEMLATCEKLFRDARSEDVTFEQRQRLKAIEEQIQKAHKGTMLAQKLAEGEYLMRTGGAPEELRSKMGEIERAIKEAGPQINNHPHIKDQLEKQVRRLRPRLPPRAGRSRARTDAPASYLHPCPAACTRLHSQLTIALPWRAARRD